ncbi:Organic hydroperoxide resistance transcriptional regulator [Tepidimonas fonticaldi]|uniref:Organic hydroperoxide resistance transcriptional regulator n=2 Tax=Tepidimonas fonticaldi TaxID=1101373 RepID=A0A554XMN5_9BURK|nr:Organic hydroperoxide resistance transcriptional regulator [Tepidimonas fonticaldi]
MGIGDIYIEHYLIVCYILHMTAPPLDPDAALRLDHQLCFALYSASLAMTRLYQPLLNALGLTYPQYLVLLALWEQDDVTVSVLGDRLGLDSGTLTPLLKRLEAAGRLQRVRDAADERRVRVRLTADGRALKARAQHIPGCVLAASGCSIGDVGTLTRQIRHLRERLLAGA